MTATDAQKQNDRKQNRGSSTADNRLPHWNPCILLNQSVCCWGRLGDLDSVCVERHYLFSRHPPCFQVNVIKGITPTCLTAKTSSLERAFWMNFKITGPHPDPTQQPPSSFLSLVTQTLFPCQHHNQTKPINPKTLKHNSQDATTHRKLWNATCNATWTELYELRRKTDHQEAGH